ncbi:hypothetical protein BDU57DRAFT_494404 [Ampelomyces quisqualis]|uniref:Gfd2/YDR514C-like C-terminal domain-containing protein n=1 Tax=Ampelomyces quisqualis TaxID=50730 RepID=A0A6A5QQD6_AMPQU|nr:hypothetical protein BDU57DRAFT_494404 [Ampelomyces quisqualis]
MASASRLDRLASLVQKDLNALPSRSLPPEPTQEPTQEEEGDGIGGILLEEPQPPLAACSKQLADRRVVLTEGVSSYNPGNMSKVTNPPPNSSALPSSDLNRGDLTAPHHHFTPIQALSKYPYRFCNNNNSQEIASAFFDAGKFWNREWDLYYVWDADPVEPLILVRENQVQNLLKEINNHLKLSLRITDAQREEGLVCRFPDHPACLPRYLGRSSSREQYNSMATNTPNRSFRAAGERPHGPPDSGTLEQFKKMMEDLWDVQKNKNKARKAAKQQERLGRQASMVDQLKRAQRYLGLRGSVLTAQKTSPSSQQLEGYLLPAPFEFEQAVVFICVDVESYERAHHKITEIGVATLDTRDLVGVAPGKDGEEWRKKIKARHFRIKEHRHLINHEFVHGYPDGFEFGSSTFVSLKEAPTHVAACFHPPFGAHPSNTMKEELASITMSGLGLHENRNLIFLGHDTLTDVKYLQQLGYDPIKVENIIEAVDTAKMYQAWRRDPQPTSLGRIMNDFDVAAWKLHNAGNDAMYTVQAMLAICVREATIRGSTELATIRQQDKAARLAAAQEAAIERANDEADGWSDSEAVGDGGAPVPLKVL